MIIIIIMVIILFCMYHFHRIARGEKFQKWARTSFLKSLFIPSFSWKQAFRVLKNFRNLNKLSYFYVLICMQTVFNGKIPDNFIGFISLSIFIVQFGASDRIRDKKTWEVPSEHPSLLCRYWSTGTSCSKMLWNFLLGDICLDMVGGNLL